MSFAERVNTTPVTFLVLLAYLTMAAVTDFMNPTTASLMQYGALTGIAVQEGEPWRLLSHAFLHGGLIHLGFNSYFLYMIGPALEERIGSLRFSLVYVVAAIGGGLGSVLWSPASQPMVGGSGALFGMMGSLLALNMRQGRHLLDFLSYSGPRMLVTLIVANLALGMLIPRVSNAGHVGGLIAGVALTFCFLERGRETPDRLARVIQGGWIALFAALIFYSIEPVTREDYLCDRLLEANRDPSTSPAELAEWWQAWNASAEGQRLHDLSRQQVEALQKAWPEIRARLAPDAPTDGK